MPAIEIEGVTTIFGPRPRRALAAWRAGAGKAELLAGGHVLALADVSLSVGAGEFFAVMGLSGSGKSTLIRHVNRLVEPTEGRIRVDGVDVAGLDRRGLEAFRRGRVAMVFQHFGLLPHRTVLENAAYGLEIRGEARAAREAVTRDWLGRVGLSGYEDRLPRALSGGMRQRVGLARALAVGTPVLLMDEPFSALDPLTRVELQDELAALARAHSRTILFVTHDLDEAARLADRIAILRDGAVVQVGTPADILERPADDHVRAFVGAVSRARGQPPSRPFASPSAG
ncbi:ATP-binding cassette domain-containing protein [Stella sp.]|uniref:ATP-binding cassette domain-containing protein n=1 Tax=Stella sp. TaxID=2912054 RepID=UPI0035B20C1B